MGLGRRRKGTSGAKSESSDSRGGDGRSGALERVADGEGDSVVGERPVGAVGGKECGSTEDVLADKRSVHAGQRVHITHHT